MNCSEAKEKIYLYNEITKAEQEQVDAHVAGCSSCQRIAAEVYAMKTAIATHRILHPQITNHALMTRRIMERIDAAEGKRSRQWFKRFQNVFHSPLQYGMGMLSLFLVVLFLGEYLNGYKSFEIRKPYRISTGDQTELNLASFHSAFLTARDTKDHSPTPFSTCVSTCLTQDDTTCDDCTKTLLKQ